ncbi:MAG: family 10 glycosylhydrolase, partial [Defluviitaleaceae bacterium]|nr:family 10 glycosylhydrolase [Defluviitaleaceae bacterium]
ASAILSLILLAQPFEKNPAAGAPVKTSFEFRAVWVTSAHNLDTPSRKGLTSAEMKSEIDRIIERAVHMQMNALVVQVRPMADALYRSDIFPWSEFLTGTQGKEPPDGFDPLAYWVERARAKGLEVHAWINPYRITSTSSKITDVNKLSANHPARLNPSWAIAYKEALYFDPGRPECRELIAKGVAEILRKYDVDGIHLDDYFYPDHSTDFPDDAMYRAHGNGMNRADWRRQNVNELIKLIQKTVKETKPGARFGISPFAIWLNKSASAPLGSETRGNESYNSHYADTRLWVKEGWLDYICPQIYWAIGFEVADYAKLLPWWEDVCRGTGVDLYIGHAAYRESDGTAGWENEIVRQLALNSKSDVVGGSVFFRANNLTGIVGERIRSFYLAQDSAREVYGSRPSPTPAPAGQTGQGASPTPDHAFSFTPTAWKNPVMDKLTVAQPSVNVSVTDAKGYNIHGTCAPDKPLYINGNLISNVTVEGFFSAYMPLVKGENKFTLTQDGQASVTRTITNKDPVFQPAETMPSAAVKNAFPSSEEMASPGDVVTLSCVAPAGASVTAALNGTTVTLTQSNASLTSGSVIYAAVFTGAYTVPQSNASTVTDLGRPVYTAVYGGRSYSATSAGLVRAIGSEAPAIATVTSETAWVFQNATTGGGSNWQLTRGQRDRITAVTGGFTRLACGGWVESENISRMMENASIFSPLSDGRYVQGTSEDMIVWKAQSFAALDVYLDATGRELTVRFGMHQTAPGHSMNFAAGIGIFQAVRIARDKATPCYVLTLRDGAKLEGFYVSREGGELRLHLKKRKTLSAGEKPLAGFSFVIDAGHGGNVSGALGMMGGAMPEKAITQSNARRLSLRLAQLGANVTTIRTT